MKSWKCEVCGYVHQGDDPPDACPVCGVGRELFRRFAAAREKPAAPGPTAWRCTICDYVYEGDAPPELCPVCGAPASMFQPLEEKGEAAAQGAGVARILVLGGGIAGVTAARRARRADAEVNITLVSKEPDLPY